MSPFSVSEDKWQGMVHVLVADLFSPEEINLTWVACAKMPWGAWPMAALVWMVVGQCCVPL